MPIQFTLSPDERNADSLERIADALERIADCLERQQNHVKTT